MLNFSKADPTSLNESSVQNTLDAIKHPALGQNLGALGLIKEVKVKRGKVSFTLELTTPASPSRDALAAECEQAVRGMEGVKDVDIHITANTRAVAKLPDLPLQQVKNIVAVASGKGGVGKSTVTTNLAMAMRQYGAKVGILDADIYGPSMPTMLGLDFQPQIRSDGKIDPLRTPSGVEVISMGFLTDDNTPVVWRGPLVHKILTEFMQTVGWSELDYLFIDLPPGTGDAQLSLTKGAPLSAGIIVTTPQDVSLIDARKGLKMFQQVNVPVLGIVENMSFYVCPKCDHREEIFGSGGGAREADEVGIPLLGSIPINPRICESGDMGQPIVLQEPDGDIGKIYSDLAQTTAMELVKLSMTYKPQPPQPADPKQPFKV